MTEKMVASRVSSYLSTVCGGMYVYLTLFLAYRNGPNVFLDAAFGDAIYWALDSRSKQQLSIFKLYIHFASVSHRSKEPKGLDIDMIGSQLYIYLNIASNYPILMRHISLDANE